MNTREQSSWPRGAKILAVLIVIIIVGFAVGIVTWIYYDQQSYINRGCEPKAWGLGGAVTTWRCLPTG